MPFFLIRYIYVFSKFGVVEQISKYTHETDQVVLFTFMVICLCYISLGKIICPKITYILFNNFS